MKPTDAQQHCLQLSSTEFHTIRATNTESIDKNNLHPYVNKGFYRAGVYKTHSYLIFEDTSYTDSFPNQTKKCTEQEQVRL
jgi:hypothetical protein